LRAAAFVACATATTPVHAEFSETSRSVHGTGEVLPEGDFELGLATADVGITDRWMLELPSVPLFFDEGSLDLMYVAALGGLRVTPRVDLERDAVFAAELYVGFDLDAARRQTLALHAALPYAFAARRSGRGIRLHRGPSDKVPAIGVEYDAYTEGWNLVYFGLNDDVPYGGFTWAWKHVHAGFICMLESNYFPLPYVYWRF
jgi:hypothetical protein